MASFLGKLTPIFTANDPLYGGKCFSCRQGNLTLFRPQALEANIRKKPMSFSSNQTDLTRCSSTTTASLANGALVLRHEIGHSIIDVGEEYDGGFAYYGVNAIHDTQNVTWSHWLTDTDHVHVERSVMPMQSYPWTLLEVGRPWSVTFSSSGVYARHLVKFSLSGIPRAGDLKVYLDGTDLGWTPRHDIGVDRWHYDILLEHALITGTHVLAFALQNTEIQGLAQLCSVEVLEFGTAAE